MRAPTIAFGDARHLRRQRPAPFQEPAGLVVDVPVELVGPARRQDTRRRLNGQRNPASGGIRRIDQRQVGSPRVGEEPDIGSVSLSMCGSVPAIRSRAAQAASDPGAVACPLAGPARLGPDAPMHADDRLPGRPPATSSP